jgi:hypothetical protein
MFRGKSLKEVSARVVEETGYKEEGGEKPAFDKVRDICTSIDRIGKNLPNSLFQLSFKPKLFRKRNV